jgi:hypothetical protein
MLETLEILDVRHASHESWCPKNKECVRDVKSRMCGMQQEMHGKTTDDVKTFECQEGPESFNVVRRPNENVDRVTRKL